MRFQLCVLWINVRANTISDQRSTRPVSNSSYLCKTLAIFEERKKYICFFSICGETPTYKSLPRLFQSCSYQNDNEQNDFLRIKKSLIYDYAKFSLLFIRYQTFCHFLFHYLRICCSQCQSQGTPFLNKHFLYKSYTHLCHNYIFNAKVVLNIRFPFAH